MTNLEYIKLQAENLFSDFQTKTTDDEGLWNFTSKYFDVDWMVLDFDLDEENLTLDDAKGVIAHICGFEGWSDLLKANEEELEIARLLFDNQNKINPDVLSHELLTLEEMNPGFDVERIDISDLVKQNMSYGLYDGYSFLDYRIGQQSHSKNVENKTYAGAEIKSNIIAFFKLQAKNLHKDYKTRVERIGDNGKASYEYKPKYLDIKCIFSDFKVDESNFTLMKAQHVIARMVGFKKWDDLLKGSLDELETRYILFSKQDTISMREFLSDMAADSVTPPGLHYAGLLASLPYYEEGENAAEDYRIMKPHDTD